MTILPTEMADVERGVPDATVARLPVYLRILTRFAERKIATCSSLDLAEAADVTPAKLRKDLSYLGSYGVRGVGYEVEYLRYQIAQAMGQSQDWNVAIIGIGHLGLALAGYRGFTSRGFKVAALVDADPHCVGTTIDGLIVDDIAHIGEVVSAKSIRIAVITTPAEAAQGAADALIAAGVVSILNFAPTLLSAPSHVDIRKVDMSTELQILAYHQQQRSKADVR